MFLLEIFFLFINNSDCESLRSTSQTIQFTTEVFCYLTPSKSEVLFSASLSTWMRWLSMAETWKIIYWFINRTWYSKSFNSWQIFIVDIENWKSPIQKSAVIQYYMLLLCLFRDIFHNKSHRMWVEESVRRFCCILKQFWVSGGKKVKQCSPARTGIMLSSISE